MVGKGKRRDELVEAVSTHGHGESSSELQALFRQHFESVFEPLETPKILPITTDRFNLNRSESGLESDWGGFSEDDGEDTEIIHHDTTGTSKADIPKAEFKTYMTSKPPFSSSGLTAKRKRQHSPDPNEASTDAANLKKDIALQRLLKESHLLDSASALSHSGQNRHKALDLRLQDMGSKSSIFKQERMPLAQRKGITAKAAEKESNRRRIAQENGIILEKAVKGKKSASKRPRGVGAPNVGKFQGGMLKLSKKDIAEIEGPKRSPRGRR